MGRFINADDIAFLGANGTLLSNNLFAYCENNPVSKVDPTGSIAGTATMIAVSSWNPVGLVVVGIVAVVGLSVYGISSYAKSAAKNRETNPIGRRKNYNTRKAAGEAAKRAGGGKEPIHHPKCCHGNKKPHYHPNVKNN